MAETPPNFIAAVRLIREMRSCDLNEGVTAVVLAFRRKGWPVPDWAERKANNG